MSFADIPLSERIQSVALQAWGIRLSAGARRLYGGEESAAYRADGASGEGPPRPVVVRVGPRWRTSEEAEWCHAVARCAADGGLAEAVVPLRTSDGRTVVRAEGRPVSLWPYVEGEWADVADQGQPERAARLLARLHHALAGADVPERPVVSDLAVGLRGEVTYRDAALHDARLDAWLAEFSRGARREHPLHGDYYHGNLLVHQGHLVGVLDWDEALVAPPEVELAGAALEFSGEFADDWAACRRFVDAYLAEGGTAEDVDDTTMAQLMRHRLRREAAYFAAAGARGTPPDQEDVDYHRRRLAAFEALRP
ncbi:phosphotransferase enzyme family protein [Streptomyces sp. NPDC057702]|uniref:phosphotransferase enzyme family protein n=1 Tax=unclassified Streptomyces TaxID=2593676 RepID=UPI00369C1686